MSGALRQGMIPSPSIGQQPGILLGGNHPGFMSNSGHMGPQPGLGQGAMGIPQNMASNAPMGMLSGGPMNSAALPRFSMPPNSMQQSLQQQQQRAMAPRQGPNPSQLNPTSANPSAAHIQSQMVGMPFPPSVMQQVAQGNNPIRRVQSQPTMNPLGGIPPSVSGNMTMNQTNQLRQLAGQQPGHPQQMQQQLRMQQQFIPGSNMDLMQMRNQNPATAVMQPNLASRPGTTPGQVMSSLTQPSIGPGPGMQAQHHQNPFPNGSMPNPALNTPRPNSTQGMAAGPSHNPPNRDGSTSVPFYGGPQFNNNNPAARGVAPSSGPPYFPTSSSPPMQMPDMRQPSPSSMSSHQGGNHASKGRFFPTPAQQQHDMGLDMFSPSFTMPPSIPRPPSHGPNPSQASHPPTPQTPSMANPQPQQRQLRPPTPQEQAQMAMDQMNQHQPPLHSQPQRPLSQASGSANNSGPGPTPGHQQQRPPQVQAPFAQGLTAAGRIQHPQQPGPHPQQQNPQGAPLMPIAPRPPTAGSMSSQGGPSSMPPPANLPHGQSAQQQQPGSITSGAAQGPQGPPRPPSVAQSPPLTGQSSQTGRGPVSSTSSVMLVNSIPTAVDFGRALLRLIEFSGVLAGENTKKYQLSFWNDCVKEFFTPQAVMKLTLWKDNQRNEAKPFEIGVPILPRFFLVTTQSGVKSMTLCLDGARERPREAGGLIIECGAAVWTYKYTNGYTVTLRGPLTVHVVITASQPPGNVNPTTGPQYALKFEEFQFDANFHDKFIALDYILGSRSTEPPLPPPLPNTPMALSAPSPMQMGGSMNSTSQNGIDDKNWEEPRVMIDYGSIPGVPVNAFGIPQATMRCLELAESVTSMVQLINWSQQTTSGPLDALKTFADKLRDSGAVLAVPQPPPLQAAPAWPMAMGAGSPFYSSSSSNTLYSSASPSLTHPPAPTQSSTPPNTNSSITNSPEKQPKAIPQQGQSASAPTSSPAISTASNTPSTANASLKRKQTGDAASPTVSNQPAGRIPRKRNRTGTNG